MCSCNITNNNIDETFFHCFDLSSHYVTYRARLSGTTEITSHTLLSYIEDWVSGGPSILVRGALLIIDHECPVSITAVDDEECTPDVATKSQNFARPAIIGGTVVAVVLIISTTLVIVVVLVRRSRHGRKLAVENTSKLVIVCLWLTFTNDCKTTYALDYK